MVCVHCRQETQVINSRPQRRSNQVWRRRRCNNCHAVFSTLERPDYEATWLVKESSGQLSPFLPDKLFLSLYNSLLHRPTAIADARALTDTVTGRLLKEVDNAIINTATIVTATDSVLKRFDDAAAVHYRAFHK